MVREPGDGLACVIAGPDAHLKRVQREVRPQRLRQLPADHAAGEHIDDERGIQPASEGAAVGDVRNPQLVRSGRGEVTFDQVRTIIRATTGDRGARALGPADASQPRAAHEPLDRATRDDDALAAQLGVDLLRPVDAEVHRMDAVDLDQQFLVA